MTRRFTGWHMLGVMLAMFGTIIAVNLIMARYAITTFGGTVVDNSYVATVRYNGWLAEARAQQSRGWRIETKVDASRRMHILALSLGGPIDGTVRAIAIHPLGRATDRQIAFVSSSPGAYVATRPLPAGRWLVNVLVTSGAGEGRFKVEVPA